MQLNLKKKFGGFHLSLAPKIRLAIGSIVLILLITAVISIVELGKMSTFVSSSISKDISDMALSTELAASMDEYNTKILAEVGDADNRISSDINKRIYLDVADRALNTFAEDISFNADTLRRAYSEFVTTADQLDTVLLNDFVDSRVWYFTVLIPKYNNFRICHEHFNAQIYGSLHRNSISFDQSVYRSLIPGTVSVAVGIIMCLLLQFFIMWYYVRPIRRILKGMESYIRFGQPYVNVFDGDDELQELNAGITDLIDENITSKKRLSSRES